MTAVAVTLDEGLSSNAFAGDDAGFGCLATERGALPLKSLDVAAHVTGVVAHTTVTQVFLNTHAQALEATYIFPLPDRAAVTAFRLEVAGRVVEGTLKERGEARREYTQAIETGHRAAISEEERPGVFTMRVGNIMPGETAKVVFTMCGVLPVDGNEATYRFPLVVAPRYIPGAALPGDNVGDGTAQDTNLVPDASRISPPVLLPGFPNPVRLSLSLDIHPLGQTLTNVQSSLHAVAARRDGDVVHLHVQPGERLNRDFIVRFSTQPSTVVGSLCVSPDATGSGATFLLQLQPPQAAVTSQTPRDVVFILDRSGSMRGWKMVAARRAVARMVDTLRNQDRFNVLAFDNSVEVPTGFAARGLMDASDRLRFQAVEWLAKVDARGGTEMAEPLQRALQVLAGSPQRDRVVVLITDGQVGNEADLLQTLHRDLGNARIFTLGIDQAVNAGFLQRLASSTGGQCELVEHEDRLDEVLQRAQQRIAGAVLRDVTIRFEGLTVEQTSIMPNRVPDLFASGPMSVMGRVKGSLEGAAVVKGTLANGSPWEARLSALHSAHGGLSQAWARGRIRDLEDLVDGGRGDRTSLHAEMLRTSLAHGVLCRLTAFVAVDRAEIVNAGGEVHQVVQPVESPEGWASLGAASGGPGGGGPAVRSRSAGAPMSPPMAQSVSKPAPMAASKKSESFRAARAEESLAAPKGDFGGMRDLAKDMAPSEERAPAPSKAKMSNAPARAPQAAPSVLGSIMQAGKNVMDALSRAPAAPAPVVVSTPSLAERANALVESMDRATHPDAWTALLMGMTAEVESLLKDARTQGLAPGKTWALEKLLAMLQAFPPQATSQQVAAAGDEARRLLKAFIQGDAPPPASRAESFWR